MREISVTEARAQFLRLVDDVERGESVTITRRGRAVARLVPARVPKRSVAEAIEAMEAFREGHTLGGITTREMIEEGRRH